MAEPLTADLRAQVLAWLGDEGGEVYVVGGSVRDRLLGRPGYDLDLVTSGDGLLLARRVADRFQGDYFALDELRSTGRAILYAPGGTRLVVDVARFRGPDLAADLADRDFTVNALAADLRRPEAIVDHHGGLADLAAGIIRPVGDGSIRNDPLRALRAVRLAAELAFRLAPETETLLRRDGQAVGGVSGERIRDELARLLLAPRPPHYLAVLDDLGLLTVILPELEPLRHLVQGPPHVLDGLAHSLETVRALDLFPFDQPALAVFEPRVRAHVHQTAADLRPRLVSLKLSALLHDTGKPRVRTTDESGAVRFLGHQGIGAEITAGALRRLRFNNTEVRLAAIIVEHHMRPLLLSRDRTVSARAVYRFFRDTGSAGIEVLLHALADHWATVLPANASAAGEQWPALVALTARMMADYWTKPAERVDPPPLLGGEDVMRHLGLAPGRQIGELLEAIREAQAVGDVRTRDEALTFAAKLLGAPPPAHSRT